MRQRRGGEGPGGVVDLDAGIGAACAAGSCEAAACASAVVYVFEDRAAHLHSRGAREVPLGDAGAIGEFCGDQSGERDGVNLARVVVVADKQRAGLIEGEAVDVASKGADDAAVGNRASADGDGVEILSCAEVESAVGGEGHVSGGVGGDSR